MPQRRHRVSHSFAGVSQASTADACCRSAHQPACQSLREDIDSQCRQEHRAHPDLSVRCRAGSCGDLQDRQGQAGSRAGIRAGDVKTGALMAIVPLIKVTLCGPAAEKNAVLDRLQSLACLHLIDLRARAAETIEVEHLDRDAREALQYLRDSPVRRRAQQQRGSVDIEALVKEALDIRDRSPALRAQRAQLHRLITPIEPWGDFELPEWAVDGALRFWFYIVPRHQARCFDAITMPWRIVTQDHRFAYAVVIANEQPANMPVAPVPLEPRSLAKLRMRLAEVERELEELDYRRIGLTLYTEVLRNALDETDDRAARRQAAGRALERDQLFAVQGWVPRRRAPALRRPTARRRPAFAIEPPSART